MPDTYLSGVERPVVEANLNKSVHIENIYDLSEFDKWTNQQSAIRHNEPYIEFNMYVSLTSFTSYFNPSELLRYNKLLLDIDKLEKSPDCVFCKQPEERHLKQ